MCLLARLSRVLAIAPVSCAAIRMTFAPWPVSVETLETRTSVLLLEFVGGRALTLPDLTSALTYLAELFQKSESDLGKSMPIFLPPESDLEPPRPQAAALSPSAATAV